MSFNIEVQGGSTVLLPTAGKYCDRDIVVAATGGSNDLWFPLIERSIEYINNESIVTLGTYAFAGCEKLTEVSLPNCETIARYIFLSATSLVSVNLPKVTEATGNMFQFCSSLKNINIPKVTELTSNSIRDCAALEKIDLPKVTKIFAQAFLNCGKLSAVILRSPSAVSLSDINAFNGTPIASGTGYIYVPAALIDSHYRTATNWTTFQFRAIEDYPGICGG